MTVKNFLFIHCFQNREFIQTENQLGDRFEKQNKTKQNKKQNKTTELSIQRTFSRTDHACHKNNSKTAKRHKLYQVSFLTTMVSN